MYLDGRSALKPGIVAGVVAVAVMVAPTLAHHGYSAYQMDKEMTLKGIITDYQMVNPHGQFAFDVKNAKGESEHWVVETSATVRGMRAGGFTKDTFKVGDPISITFNPSVNGTSIGVLVSITGPDGKTYPMKQAPTP